MNEKEYQRIKRNFIESLKPGNDGGLIRTIETGKRHPYLRQLKEQEIRQVDAARLIGVSQTSLNRMLNGYDPL